MMERKDPNCMFVDPGMMTCYPTNQTVARQNEYTRVICEYLPLSSPSPSATLRLFAFRLPFGISFTLRPAAGSSVCVWPRPTPPHDHQCPICFPPMHSSLTPTSPRPDQIWTSHESTQVKLIQHQGTLLPPPSPQCLIEHPNYASLLPSRRSTRAPIYPHSLSMGASLLSPSPISTCTATL